MTVVSFEVTKRMVSLTAVTGALMSSVALASSPDSSAWIDYSPRNSQGVVVTRILDRQPVSVSQVNALQSSIANHNGRVYTANIEPGAKGDINGIGLHTVLRQGQRTDDGGWSWTSQLIDDRTVFNPWHTAPAVGVDQQGYVHVAYNMHNTPWQYVRSVNPEDISEFTFLGQAVSDDELHALKYRNRTNFPDLGTAAIPGNQITYPAFTRDQSGALHVAYRFAARPDQRFSRRSMSAGIASYDVESRTWSPVGGNLKLNQRDWQAKEGSRNDSVPFAASTGWTASSPQLAFDADNTLHVGMSWREGLAGVQYTRPCVFLSDDKVNFYTPEADEQALPVTVEDCSNKGLKAWDQFYNMASLVVAPSGVIYYLAHSLSNGVAVFSRTPGEDFWRRERGLNGVSDIFVDREGSLWAVASGLRLYKRDKDASKWRTVYHNKKGNDCFPRVSTDLNKQFVYVHTQACDKKSVSVYSVQLH